MRVKDFEINPGIQSGRNERVEVVMYLEVLLLWVLYVGVDRGR